MGIRLMVEVLDHAPATLTPRERWALIAIAEDARDETRLCLKGIESNPDLVRRMRTGRSERAAIISALIDKGALERVKRGQMYQHAVFRIPPLTPTSVRETQTLGQHPDFPDAGDSQGPGSAAPGSGNSGPRVRETRMPSPQSPQVPSSLSGEDDETRDEREKSPSDDLTTRLATQHGATADEVTAVLAGATRDGIRSVAAWTASEVGHADFTNRLAELRRANQPAPARPTCGQCTNGWLGEDDEGRPICCPTCKPHAARQAG
jgi:hypothetical protein